RFENTFNRWMEEIRDWTISRQLWWGHQIPAWYHSERSGAVVEPYLSTQWFVKMKPLAQQALDNQKTDNRIDFYPPRFENTFNRWMEEIRDWTISRQLWWGHQIPAWYH
ncbi:hypothetical protein BUE67_15015, partial [Corynebacterium diphtheriae]